MKKLIKNLENESINFIAIELSGEQKSGSFWFEDEEVMALVRAYELEIENDDV